MKINKKCVICGTSYAYCSGCKGDIDMPRWKFLFHDENCKNIYEIVNDFGCGKITADEARVEMKKVDLSDKDNFAEGIRGTIDKIFQNEKESAKQVKENDVKKK